MKAKVINKNSTHYGKIYPVLERETDAFFSIRLECGLRGRLWFNENEVELINEKVKVINKNSSYYGDICEVLDKVESEGNYTTYKLKFGIGCLYFGQEEVELIND